MRAIFGLQEPYRMDWPHIPRQRRGVTAVEQGAQTLPSARAGDTLSSSPDSTYPYSEPFLAETPGEECSSAPLPSPPLFPGALLGT